LKLRAERRLGEMLAEMPKHNGDPRLHDATRLSDLGIGRMDSSRWQRIAGKVTRRYLDGYLVAGFAGLLAKPLW
jgi:hypothetical protein